VIVGGMGNNWGVIVGTFLVQIVFQEVPSLLPQVGYIGLIDSLEWVIVGLLWLLCLAFRPKGLLPERRYKAPQRFRLPVLGGRGADGGGADTALAERTGAGAAVGGKP